MYFGSEKFVDTTLAKIEDDRCLAEMPLVQRRPIAQPLSHCEEQSLNQNSAICLAHQRGGYSLQDLGRHYSTVIRIIRQAKGKT